ncbi:Protein of unknown function [Gryllus bimaculatus]|nr:Protein of unknown function [Gryllus bimaculatus]
MCTQHPISRAGRTCNAGASRWEDARRGQRPLTLAPATLALPSRPPPPPDARPLARRVGPGRWPSPRGPRPTPNGCAAIFLLNASCASCALRTAAINILLEKKRRMAGRGVMLGAGRPVAVLWVRVATAARLRPGSWPRPGYRTAPHLVARTR